MYGAIPVWRPGYLCCGCPKITPGCTMVGRNNKVKIIWLYRYMHFFALHLLKSSDIWCWFPPLNRIHSTYIFQSYAPLTVTLVTALKVYFQLHVSWFLELMGHTYSNGKVCSTFFIVKLVTYKMDCRINYQTLKINI